MKLLLCLLLAGIGGASNWSHASAMAAYNDAELDAILAYLRTALNPEKP